MDQERHPTAVGRWTRARFLRAAMGSGAVLAGGAAIGARGDGASRAAPSNATDAEILNLFLLLERVQEGFYREAVRAGALTGELSDFARAVGEQETDHVAFLTERLGGEARERPQLEFPGDLLDGDERFRDSAIELEEVTIGAYIGQSANLTRETMEPIATVLAVEARQVAWVRDIAGISPAPRAADEGRDSGEVLDFLRRRGYIR